MAVLSGDAKAISKAPGVGAKTAQRIILDLKDKVKAEDVLFAGVEPEETGKMEFSGMAEAGKRQWHSRRSDIPHPRHRRP